jgi:ATP-dependent DNA ligase
MTGRIGYPRLRGPSASQVVLDGELVAVRPDGVTSFPTLQAALSAGAE